MVNNDYWKKYKWIVWQVFIYVIKKGPHDNPICPQDALTKTLLTAPCPRQGLTIIAEI